MMSIPGMQYGVWASCLGWLWIVVTLLCVPAAAQTIAGSASKLPLLTPWTTLSGAWLAVPANAASKLPHNSAFSGYLSWQLPTVVAARANHVYVVDGGRRQIYRYDLHRQTMTPFADYAAGAVAAIAVAPDLSLYVADIGAHQVLHFSVDGRLLRTFNNQSELVRPVAVLLDEPSARLWVADSLLNHVVVFNSLGRVLAVLRSNVGRSIEAMAQGPDGLYLVDRLSRQVVVIGQDGADRYTLGQGTLKMPGVIAVDRFNRVFVSDSFDNTIKVYEQGQLLASVGGSGVTPASFNRITSLWIEQNMLYVADSLNARIQTFHVAPPGAPARPLAE